MRAYQVQEPIKVVKADCAPVPKAFTWRARQYRVWRVEALRDEWLNRAQGYSRRTVYHVRTHKGLSCSISFDEERGRWQMEAVHARGVKA
jgi:hypothetical protein